MCPSLLQHLILKWLHCFTSIPSHSAAAWPIDSNQVWQQWSHWNMQDSGTWGPMTSGYVSSWSWWRSPNMSPCRHFGTKTIVPLTTISLCSHGRQMWTKSAFFFLPTCDLQPTFLWQSKRPHFDLVILQKIDSVVVNWMHIWLFVKHLQSQRSCRILSDINVIDVRHAS